MNNSNESDVKTENVFSMTNIMENDAQQGFCFETNEKEKSTSSFTFQKFPSYNEYMLLSKTDKEKIWLRVRVLVEDLQQKGINPFSL